MSQSVTKNQQTVAGAILDLLWQSGIRVTFGIPGVHNLAFWDALGQNRPTIVGVRHEQTAAYAADGLARTTGNLAVALTTTGPGAANTVAAFGEAAISGSPIFVIASEAPISKRGRNGSRGLLHEMDDQAALFAPLAKKLHGVAMAISVEDGVTAVEVAAEMIRDLLRAPAGAGYLGIPADVLGQPFAGEIPKVEIGQELIEVDTASTVAALNNVKKIVIWAGGGATEGSEGISELAAHWNAPILTSFAGRGIAAQSPFSVKVPIHETEVEEVFGDADALVVFGSQLDGMNTKNWTIKWPAKIVVVDANPDFVLRNVNADSVITANDINKVARALISDTKPQDSWVDIDNLNNAVRSRLDSGEKSKRGTALVRAIEENWPADGVIVCDMAVAGYWTGVYADQPRPRRLVYPVGWGTLGFGLPAAIGPAAAGVRTLAVCGDGGVAFALGELATIVQEKLPYTLLIVDDGGYGMLRFDQIVMGHPERGVDLVSPDWAVLAQAFGLSFTETTVEDLGEALSLKQPGIVLVREKLHPPKSTSPRWNE
jgi:thiamine pyrophosphate-dependent acetolactate synthase large subunit-like protein